jgi:hypothetical protein
VADELEVLGAGCRVLVLVLSAGCWVLGARCWVLGAGRWAPDAEYEWKAELHQWPPYTR